MALRTQQIIAEESGVTNTVDPLGGSYVVEALTDRIEREADRPTSSRSTSMGGIVRAIELGFPQKEIADAGYHAAPGRRRREGGGRRQPVRAAGRQPIPYLRIDDAVEREQVGARARGQGGAEPGRGRGASCSGSPTPAGAGRT